MFAILVSAANVLLGFIFRSIIVKFVFFFGLYFVTSEFVPVVLGLLPDTAVLSSAFQNVPPSVAYFLQIFMVGEGLSMIFAAYVTRFLIRRIPVIG